MLLHLGHGARGDVLLLVGVMVATIAVAGGSILIMFRMPLPRRPPGGK